MKNQLSNFSSSLCSDDPLEATKQREQVEHVEVLKSVSSTNSLDPNEPDNGLKRTLKPRHLAVTYNPSHVDFVNFD